MQQELKPTGEKKTLGWLQSGVSKSATQRARARMRRLNFMRWTEPQGGFECGEYVSMYHGSRGVVESRNIHPSHGIIKSWNRGIPEKPTSTARRSRLLPRCIYNPIANNCQHFPTLPADMSAETPRTGVRK